MYLVIEWLLPLFLLLEGVVDAEWGVPGEVLCDPSCCPVGSSRGVWAPEVR